MGAKHHLSLEIPETANTKLFRVSDTSLYANDLAVECPTLQILAPGFNAPKDVEAIPGFNYVLNACTLGLQVAGCGDVNADIPDGIYVIRYSVSPNTQVFVEYNYLRVTAALNLYYTKLGELDVKACEPDQEIKSKLAEMRLIKSMIDAAKAKVEYCHNPKQGYELFVYALKRLEKVCV